MNRFYRLNNAYYLIVEPPVQSESTRLSITLSKNNFTVSTRRPGRLDSSVVRDGDRVM